MQIRSAYFTLTFMISTRFLTVTWVKLKPFSHYSRIRIFRRVQNLSGNDKSVNWWAWRLDSAGKAENEEVISHLSSFSTCALSTHVYSAHSIGSWGRHFQSNSCCARNEGRLVTKTGVQANLYWYDSHPYGSQNWTAIEHPQGKQNIIQINGWWHTCTLIQ